MSGWIPRAQTRRALWVAAAGVMMLATGLGGRVLINNDEARFPLLAQDILSSGEWLLPRINAEVYSNKPVLLAWLIALVSWPVGHVTQLTAVLPSLGAGLATVLIVYRIGLELFGSEAGWVAALVVTTCQGFFLHARLPMPDMLMTCFITASIWLLLRSLRGDPGPYWVGFYGFTAAAFWSKGPAGLLPLAVALVYRLATRRSPGGSSLHMVPGLALVGALVALWPLLGALGEGSAIRHAVVVDQLQWYSPHLPTLATLTAPVRNSFGILFPWALIIPVVVAHAMRFLRWRGAERDRVLFLLVWASVTLALIGLSHQQRLRYYLPLVPAVALLIGWWVFGRLVQHRKTAPGLWRVYLTACGVTTAATIADLVAKGGWPGDAQLYLPASASETTVTASALILIVIALWRLVRADRPRLAFIVAWLGSAVLLVAGSHWETQRRNAAHDYPRFAASANPLLHDAAPVVTWGVPALPIAFYLDRSVVAVESDAALRAATAGHPESIVILSEAALAQVRERDRLTVVALDRLGPGPISLAHYVPPRWAELHSEGETVTGPAEPASGWRGARFPREAATHSLRLDLGSETADLAWEVAAIVIALLGVAIRFQVAGTGRRCSPHDLSEPPAELGYAGAPHPLVRHPICAANLLIVLGLSLFPHVWILPLVVVPVVGGYYWRKIRRLDRSVRRLSDGAFGHLATQIHAMAPRLSRCEPVAHPFAWKVALTKEYRSLVAILVLPLFLDLFENFWETPAPSIDAAWTLAALAGATLFVVLKMRAVQAALRT